MSFFKRLFNREPKAKPEAMHGSGPLQTEPERDAVRSKMEGEMTANRDQRAENAPEKAPDKP